MKGDIVWIIRRFQTISSIVIFLIVLSLCWVSAGLDITKIQLSHWSVTDPISKIWNNSLILLGISTWINQWIWLKRHRRISKKILPKILFTLVSVCLVLTGIFTVDFKILHNIFAFSYFLLYPLSIFITSYLNRSSIRWSNWVTMMITSISMITIPLVILPIWEGMAMAELAHSGCVIWWNIWILTKGVN